MLDLKSIRIVLVNTSHPGNIGATARAMKNMGLHHLYLVNPADYPSGVALGRAASALDVLDDTVVCATLEEAIADCSLVIGTSARSRHLPLPVLEPWECADRLTAAAAGGNQAALLFGREASGLSNEQLLMCHYHVQIPANPDYSSLNLAASAMVLCYEIRKSMLSREQGEGPRDPRVIEERWDRELATAEQVDLFLEHLERVLVRIDFHDPDNPRRLMERMRRLYNRIRPDQMEINILRGILTATEKGLDKSDDSSTG